jgi:hypothetical protein
MSDGVAPFVSGAGTTVTEPIPSVVTPGSVKFNAVTPASVLAVSVSEKVPVRVVVELVSVPVSTRSASLAPVRVQVPPSPVKFVPVTVTVPDVPTATEPVFVVEKTTDVTVAGEAALAVVAIAIGNAAAASKAPAASAFTKWRCIRRGLFIVNCSIHKGRPSSL